MGPHNGQGIEGAATDEGSSMNSLSCFFSRSCLSPNSDVFFVADKSEKLNQFEVNTQDLLVQIDKSDVSKSLGLDNIHPSILKELKYEIAELLAVMCNIITKSHCAGGWVHGHLQNCQLLSTKKALDRILRTTDQ